MLNFYIVLNKKFMFKSKLCEGNHTFHHFISLLFIMTTLIIIHLDVPYTLHLLEGRRKNVCLQHKYGQIDYSLFQLSFCVWNPASRPLELFLRRLSQLFEKVRTFPKFRASD